MKNPIGPFISSQLDLWSFGVRCLWKVPRKESFLNSRREMPFLHFRILVSSSISRYKNRTSFEWPERVPDISEYYVTASSNGTAIIKVDVIGWMVPQSCPVTLGPSKGKRVPSSSYPVKDKTYGWIILMISWSNIIKPWRKSYEFNSWFRSWTVHSFGTFYHPPIIRRVNVDLNLIYTPRWWEHVTWLENHMTRKF